MTFDPMQLLRTAEELSGRVAAGVNCEDCPAEAPRSASGWCVVCKTVLCPDHDIDHLMRTCPVKP